MNKNIFQVNSNAKTRGKIRLNTALFGAILLVTTSISLIFAGCEAASGDGSQPAAPGAPSNLKADVESRDSVRLTWTAPARTGQKKPMDCPIPLPVTRFIGCSPIPHPMLQTLCRTAMPVRKQYPQPHILFQGLTEGKTYYFVVTAKNTTGSGNPSQHSKCHTKCPG